MALRVDASYPPAVRRGGGSLAFGAGGVGTFAEQPVTLPSLDPANRTERLSTGWTSRFAPGPDGGTIEYRHALGCYENTNGTFNAVVREGWNVADSSGNPIVAGWGIASKGIESSFFDGTRLTSEIHPAAFRSPGGDEVRPFTAQQRWDTGYFSFGIEGTGGRFSYQPLVGSRVDLLAWDGASSINLAGNGFYLNTNAQRFYHQLNGSGTGFIDLPYVSGDEVWVGFDPITGTHPPLNLRVLRFTPIAAAGVPTPAAGFSLFLDSGSNTFKVKDTGGTVSSLASVS
jgi:hypothetical protein